MGTDPLNSSDLARPDAPGTGCGDDNGGTDDWSAVPEAGQEPGAAAAEPSSEDLAWGNWTDPAESRSPLGCVDADATTERTTMYGMLQRLTLQVLLGAGVKQSRIQKFTKIPERTIRRIGLEPPVRQGADGRLTQEGAKRPVGRPAKASRHEQIVRAALEEDDNMLSVDILRRMKKGGYDGRRAAAYALVASLRKKKAEFVVRCEGLPGEFTQHDFGEVRVRYADGSRSVIHFFATRLKYSRWVQVTIVPNERAETLIRALLDHFTELGGIPLVAVFDRPTTIAEKWGRDGKVSKWNSTSSQALFGLGLGVELCWPGRGQEKGSVENLVKWVKGSLNETAPPASRPPR